MNSTQQETVVEKHYLSLSKVAFTFTRMEDSIR